MKKIILFHIFIAVYSSTLLSQTNMQVFGSYVKNLNKDYKGLTYGVGIRFEFGKDDAFFNKYIGFAYNGPITTHAINEARAYSSLTDPQTIDVPTVYKIPAYRLEGGGRLYFSGSAHNYDGMNAFLNCGAEVIFAPNHPEYTSYDQELYTLGYTQTSDVNEDGTDKFALNLMLALGAGIEKNFGPGNIFLHVAIALPVIQNGTNSDIEDFVPVPLNFNAGYKFSLSK